MFRRNHMAAFDWNGLGNDIRDLVQDAIDTRDFNKLNSDLNRTLQQAIDGVGSSVREAGRTAGQAVDAAAKSFREQAGRNGSGNRKYASSWQGDRYGRATHQNAGPVSGHGQGQAPMNRVPLFVSTTGRKTAACLMAIGGFVFAGIFGILSLVVLFSILSGFLYGGEILRALAGVGLPFLGTLFLGTKGMLRLGQVQRFRSYIRILGGRAFCDLKELAAQTGKSLSYIRRDLRKLVEKNWFLQGHLDKQETCLIVTNEMYQRYLQTEASRLQRQQEKQKEQELAAQDGISPQVREVLEAGEAYVKRLRKCNEDIPGVEISNKIFRIEELVQQIFARVKEHPEMVSDIRKMMEYYLPTTIKLLDAYIELDAQSVQGEHIANSKREIEDVLDTLNVAFEKLLDSLFRDAAWDVSADISVLETMLAQEGLTNSDFRREPK